MNTERDEFFSRQDADEWGRWSEELEPEGEEALNDYLVALHSYYGNLRHDTTTD